MKRILWCGGSHVGNAKRVIGMVFPDVDNTFYVTAGPTNLRWAREGGRYSVNGSIVGANGRSPSVFHDLAEYDRIVFVGHWIQPQVFMEGPAPLSDGVLDEMFPESEFLINMPRGRYNEVLEVFPRIAPGKCVLVCDPLSNKPEFEQVPVMAKARFLKKAAAFCAERGIGFVSQPEGTLNRSMVTDRKFNRRDGDFIHMNNRFWKLYLKKVRTYLEDHQDGLENPLLRRDESHRQEILSGPPLTVVNTQSGTLSIGHAQHLSIKRHKQPECGNRVGATAGLGLITHNLWSGFKRFLLRLALRR